MPSTINAGASSTIALAAGEYLVLDGIGTAQVVSAMPPNVDVSVRRFSVGATVGPFDVAASVRVVAGSQGAVSVDVDGPGVSEGPELLASAFDSPLKEPVAADQILRAGRSQVGWSIVNGGGASATMAVSAAGSPFGYPALKVVIPNDTGYVDVIADGLGLAGFTAGIGNLVWHVYVEEELGVKQWQVHAGNDASFTRSMSATYSLSNNNINRANGHHIGGLNIASASANTLLTTDAVDRLRLRFFGQPSGGVVWIEGVYVPKPVYPWMIVTVDDSDVSMWTRFRRELRNRGLLGTFAIDWTNVGTNSALFVNQSQLQAMYDEGHDLSSHNQTNTAYPDENPPTAQPSDAARLSYCSEYRFTRNVMRGLGWTRALGYHPFVQGAHDGALVDAMKAHGMVVGRTTGPGHIEPFRASLQSVFRQRQLGNGFSLAAAKTWVDAAEKHKQDFALMGHILADTASSSITWAQSDFGALLDYAIERGLRVGSVSQWASDRGIGI